MTTVQTLLFYSLFSTELERSIRLFSHSCLSVSHLNVAAFTGDTEEAVLKRAAQEEYVQKILARWRSAGLDLLILPGFACPPPPRDKISDVNGKQITSITDAYYSANRILVQRAHETRLGVVCVVRKNADYRLLRSDNRYSLYVCMYSLFGTLPRHGGFYEPTSY